MSFAIISKQHAFIDDEDDEDVTASDCSDEWIPVRPLGGHERKANWVNIVSIGVEQEKVKLVF